MRTAILALTLLASTGAPQAAEPAYRVGERLNPASAPAAARNAYKDTAWDSLMPADWDPMKAVQNLQSQQFGALSDNDPRAQEALQRMQEAWRNAPVNTKLDGTKVRIPGFVVPLDAERGLMKEFLLVPYFGACIHTPPPPSNQVIHVRTASPVKGFNMMDAVWVQGTLKVERVESDLGSAGYTLSSDQVIAFKPGDKVPR